MSKRRLLMLLSPEGDAAARDVAEHCAAVRDRYDVTVLARRERRAPFEAAGAAFVPWRPSGIFGMAASIRTLRRHASRRDPAIVHAHGFPAIAVALGTFPHALAARTVATFHDPLRTGELPKRLVERKLPGFVERAAAVTATYPALAASLEKRFGRATGSIKPIAHGVDVSGAGVALARPPSREGPLLGWRGTLNADRAWEVAVDSLARTRQRFPSARLLIEGDGRARQFVNAYVRQNGLAPYVHFLGAAGARELFAAIDLLLVPISRDAQPHAPLEALVAGVPVIAANVGALADALTRYDTGWLVDDEAQSFALGIEAAWNHIDRARADAAVAQADARERYARQTVTQEYLDAYAQGSL